MDRETITRLAPVFFELNSAQKLANRMRTENWQFAIESSYLMELGATLDDLSVMVNSGLVLHGVEISKSELNLRAFQPASSISDQSCFVLTNTGLEAMRGADLMIQSEDELKPHWNSIKSELRIAGQLIKQFKWRAPNQETLLSAFQEAGWPERLDDPLPGDELVDPKRRLHDTIKCLNRRHEQNLMRFHGDGTGQGVLWRVVEVKDKSDDQTPPGGQTPPSSGPSGDATPNGGAGGSQGPTQF